jgi:hypothetical protein
MTDVLPGICVLVSSLIGVTDSNTAAGLARSVQDVASPLHVYFVFKITKILKPVDFANIAAFRLTPTIKATNMTKTQVRE